MSNVVNLNDFKNSRTKNNVNTDFMKALDRLSKQNGLDYEKMILGNLNEKKMEKEKYVKKMELARKKIELMEG
ncbi:MULTISPECIES: hypothetical protein [Enterococcus]|uniref:hypothetical protein n=1 Tax=Enterococcus TaxID=1350 RepID=UPI001157F4EB|nr:hypothetical protein [Enterococcus faecalis]EMF0525544.1 hypothetical protein [Enterococcus hirae]HAP3558358.1 hypothetical protein [Enterococcus faecalis]